MSFSFSWAAQLEAWSPALCWELVLTARSETLLQNSDLQLQLFNQGPEGPLCWVLVLSTASYLQLTDFLSSPRLYNCLTPTFFLWASQITLNLTCPRSRLYPDIPQPDAPVIYTGAFSILTAWFGQRSICNTDCSKQWLKQLLNWETLTEKIDLRRQQKCTSLFF